MLQGPKEREESEALNQCDSLMKLVMPTGQDRVWRHIPEITKYGLRAT